VQEGKLPLAKDSLDKMLKDIYPTMGQVSNVVSDYSVDECMELAGFFSLLQLDILFMANNIKHPVIFCRVMPTGIAKQVKALRK
jgi:hypothetical protein